MIFRLGGLWLVGLSCAVTLGACGGVSSEVGSMNDGGGGQGPECAAGATKPAGDGCNTCACDHAGNWACTQLECGVCVEGATRRADDGCNNCVCTEGEWSCTLVDCQTCTIGETREDDCGSCWCADNGSGPTWNCTANYCPAECEAGDTKPAGDGCNACTCTDGTWSCTDVDCPECTDGEMRPAGDDCNSCTCRLGTWSCTMKFCGQMNCEAGRADCDADPATGCEVDIESSADNCGSCGYVCNVAGGSAACEAGMCVPDQCDAPYADCNGDPTDGCEAPVGEGGCADRCEPADPALVPIAAGASCECPEGMACVRRDRENMAACIPIPEGCSGGFASCLCMADCACDEGSTCLDEMSLGGMIINCTTTP